MLSSELDVLKFWQENNTFEKSIKNREGAKPFVFLDGPPFATGTPHWGHIFISQVKDTVLRYQTQKGKYVPRRWGWDCHGVPIEALVEKELNIKDKRQIEEEVGIEEFNNGCRSRIFTFDQKWREVIERVGRWVDMDDQYRTMDNEFGESVWWGLSKLWEKDLIYKGYRISLYSPSLGVPLSHTDVAMEVKYEDETLDSPVVRFKAKEESVKELLKRVEEQIEEGYNEQLKYKDDAEKEVKILEKKEYKKPSFREFVKDKSNNFESLESEEFKREFKEKSDLEEMREQLELVKQNIKTLEKLKEVLAKNKDCPFNLLAWTTTPWTLASNSALVVGQDIEYSVYFLPSTKEFVAVAENRAIPVISLHFQDSITDSPEVVKKLSEIEDSSEYFEKLGLDIIKIVSLTGSDLIGMGYDPIFEPTHEIDSYEQKANLFKVYPGDFVADDEGTGIIHMAPYGEDDFKVIQERNLPLLLCLNEHGEMLEKGLNKNLEPVFGKKYEEANPLINRILEKEDHLFGLTGHTHRIPVFDRDGKKVYYAPQEGWFVAETKIKKRALELNEDINWYPESLKYGRFGKGIETAPDWSISRNRYWGTPIPVWENKDKTKTIFVDSIEKLANMAVNPIYRLINSRDLDPEVYQNQKTVIFSDSQGKLPLGISAAQYRSKNLSQIREQKELNMKKFSYHAQQMLEEVLELFEKYETVQILLSNEEQVMWTTWLAGLHPKSKKNSKIFYFYKRVELDLDEYVPVGGIQPLDLHRPYIDDIVLKDDIDEVYHRVPEVLDCWVESGSMPWASIHYPFENKEVFEKTHPADWIVEAQDQTRGWFRVLHILSTGIFDKPAFKNVSTSGLIMAKDGKKMSKSKKNYSDPEELLQKFGSDALRLYLLSSTLLNAESVSFNDDELSTVFRDSTLLLGNTAKYVEFVLSSNARRDLPKKYKHPLNKWWIAYTKNYAAKIDALMEEYNLIEAARLVIPYINDLSTWYIRRSKDLLQTHGEEVAACLIETIKLFASATAPIQPFNTERLWSVVKTGRDEESVHLTNTPKPDSLNKEEKTILINMEKVRELVSEIHSVRKDNDFRVRQPLYADFSGMQVDDSILEILKKECNLIDKDLSKTEGEVWENKNDFGKVRIDLVIDDDLKVLGFVRDFERAVQNFRKKQGYKPNQLIRMEWQILETENEKILKEVLKKVDWQKLHLDVRWIEDIKEESAAKVKVKGLTTILVK